MKTSSMEFNSRSPTPSPMESKQRRFVLLRRLFEPWKWKRKKKSDRFEQTSRTLERKISMRSTLRRFSSGLHEKKKGISTAADSVRSGWPLWNRLWSRHPIESLKESTQSSRAGAANPK
ncbi:phosphatase and actin regulator 2 [Trichonephila clavipes]|nr:phosphatase and actin regulator 2 [Trichonephila clavipes]